jgi:hypothetical protein
MRLKATIKTERRNTGVAATMPFVALLDGPRGLTLSAQRTTIGDSSALQKSHIFKRRPE